MKTHELNVGLLWYDNDRKRSLIGKIDRAAHHYQRKFGRQASLCFVHPSMLEDKNMPMMAGDIKVRAAIWVLPNHFFIGENGEEK